MEFIRIHRLVLFAAMFMAGAPQPLAKAASDEETESDSARAVDDSPAETPVKPKTYQEILAARPAPDLTTLVERSSPENFGPESTEAFWDILKTREIADPATVNVLEQILVENRRSPRIHKIAAAQALFTIGTPEAHRILAEHLLADGIRANSAIGSAWGWNMPEPLRSRFIQRYLLVNLSKSLVVELSQARSPNPPKGQLNLIVNLRNTSKEAFHILDRQDFPGDLLYLRDAKGQFLPRVQYTKYCPEPSDTKYVELKPGQSHRVTITFNMAVPKCGADGRDKAAGLAIEVRESARRFDLGAPGRFEILAMFEAEPMTADQRNYLKVDESWKWWTGRAVSKPLAVELPLPAPPSATPPKR